MRANRALVLVATGMVAIGWGGPVGAVDPTLPAQSEQVDEEQTADDEATEAEAIRFRQSFGLRSDAEFVRATRLDKSGFSTDPYGVPLSPDEVADLLHRGKIQLSVGDAVEAARKSEFFAGAYIDQLSGGQPVFMFTSSDPTAEERIAAALPADTEFRIEGAARTERELLSVKDRIDGDVASLSAAGIEVVRVEFKASRNTLRVGVHGLTDSITESLAERYGPGLIVFEDGVAQADSCTSTNNCRPIKGGLAINLDGGIVGACTSGFIVHKYDSNTWLLLTAGHCIQANGGFDKVWEHNNNSFGRSLRETWMPGGTGPADVGLISINSDDVALMTNKNQIRRTNSTVTAVRTVTFSAEGYQACRVGITSGHDCGLVSAFPASRLSSVTGWSSMTVTRAATYNFDSLGGDSGGPVFFYASTGDPTGGTLGPEISALGTHVHSETGPDANESWYSPIYTGSDDYELETGGFAYRPCLTATCLN